MKRLKLKNSMAILLSGVMAFGMLTAMPITAGAVESFDSVSDKSADFELDYDELTMSDDSVTYLCAYTNFEDYESYEGNLTWSSSDTSVATVKDYTEEYGDSAYARINSTAPGTTVITATADDGSSANCTVTVVEKTGIELTFENEIEISLGSEYITSVYSTYTYDDIECFDNYCGNVTWTSSDESVATVEGYIDEDDTVYAFITPVSVGTTVITAATDDGYSASFTAVIGEIFLTETAITIDKGSEYILLPKCSSDVTWTSSNESVATVTKCYIDQTYSYGTVTAVAPGTTVITATTESGSSASCIVTVTDNIGYTLGDVNEDGEVDISDATAIQKAVAQIIELTDSQNLAADVNGDDVVDINDATEIQKYAAQITMDFTTAE